MPNEERTRDRESDLQQAIRKLQTEILTSVALSNNEDSRKLYGFMASILSILNSEYGTMIRMLDRMDKTDDNNTKLFDRLVKAIEGTNGNDKDSVSLRDVYNSYRMQRKYRFFVVTTLSALALTKSVEVAPKLIEFVAKIVK